MNNIVNKTLIVTISFLLLIFYFWADFTELDLVTKGEGRLIVEGKNQSLQVSDTGIISQMFVSEGDKVYQDEILALVSPTDAEGSLEEIRKRIAFHSASIQRIDSWINERSDGELQLVLRNYDPEVASAQIALFQAISQDVQLNQLNFKNRREQLEIDANIHKLELQSKTAVRKSVETEALEILPLVEKGVVGNSERYRIEREISNLDAQVLSIKAQIEQNTKAQEQLSFEEKSFLQSYKTGMLNERLEHVSEIDILSTNLPRLTEKLELTEIRSPIDGIINRIYVKSTKAVVKSGEVLLDIVPASNNLQIEAFIDPKDIAKVEVGQPTRIALTAYDASKYGFITGYLTNVSADAVFREDRNDYMFKVTAVMNSNLSDSDGSPVPLNAGMIAQIDIIRGKQTLLEYFWQPVAKIKDDAFRQ